ncbi:MAG: phage terminase large subunit family protein [Planctomycetes bacterium]|nr:phage terminase large subunit family protein [Planctomycetota bacterium]
MNRFEWCGSFVYLRGRPISFDGRPYLRAIYNSDARRIVLRCSRQVEKTTFICNVVAHAAVMLPGVRIIVVFPRQDQASVFAKSRLQPLITESPVLRRILLGKQPRKQQVSHMRFENKSEVYIRSAYRSADAARGIDGDYLLIDEYQDIAGGDLPVLEEALSHSPHRRVFLTGTPKSIDNHLEDAFNRSTANEWRVPCECGQSVFLDEKCLGPYGPVCPSCQSLIDPKVGQWISRNPESAWGDGFTINHLATPWLDYPLLLEHQESYNPALFRNECIGLPTYLGDHIVTRDEVEQCCTNRPMATALADVPQTARHRLLAGIDWGGGVISRTVLVIGYMLDDDRFNIVHMAKYRAQEDADVVLREVSQRCNQFGVRLVAADGLGNGSVYNNLLLANMPRLAGLYAMQYSVSDQAPRQYKGRLWNWTIGRTPSIGMVFTRVKKKRIQFPRVEDCSSFLDEIWCEVAVYDDHQRMIKYTHPETQPDDALHAVNYAAILARMLMTQQYEG